MVTNATQYAPPGGPISVSTTARYQNDQSWIIFTVKDTGLGIQAADLPRSSERFYRGEAGRRSGVPGIGWGLAICSDLAEKMGDHLTVESHPHRGVAFSIWLRPGEE